MIGSAVARSCLYCGTVFQRNEGKRLNTNAPTIDHVYPKTAKLPPGLTKWNSAENKVKACHWCNHKKGQMHPLRWLTYCPSESGAAALAELLKKLGEDVTKVDHALNWWRAHNGPGET